MTWLRRELIADWKLLGLVTSLSGVLLTVIASLATWSEQEHLATRPAMTLLLIGGIMTAVCGVGIAKRKPKASLIQCAIWLMWSGYRLLASDSWSSVGAAVLWLVVPVIYWANYLADRELSPS